MTADATALANQVKILLGGSSSQKLIELTNQDNSATTINDTVLEKCCQLAIGAFRFRSGIEPDTSTPNYTHVEILVHGVQYQLEAAKGRDNGTVNRYQKDFNIGCEKLRSLSYVSATTNSSLQPSIETANSLPDMDRSKPAFAGRRLRRNSISEHHGG